MIYKYELPDNVLRFVYRDGDSTVLSDELYLAVRKSPIRPVPGGLNACGIKTAQNVLDFFNIGLPESLLLPHFSVHELPAWLKWISSGHWVYPSSLRGGLEECLHQYGCPNFVVRMEHGQDANRVKELLKNGYPVVAMVDSGFHWITVVGYGDDSGFDVLDNTSATKRATIDMGFHGPSRYYDWITDTSFKAGTLLYLESTVPISVTPVSGPHLVPPPGGWQKACLQSPAIADLQFFFSLDNSDVAINRWAAASGFVTGVWNHENDGSHLGAICLPASAADLHAPAYSELEAAFPGNPDVAAHRWACQHGYVAGKRNHEDDGAHRGVIGIKPGTAELRAPAYAELEAVFPGNYDVAAHRWATSHGYLAGALNHEDDGAHLGVICFRS
jgi:hypothetical protein